MAEVLTLDKLKSHLWKSANILRGSKFKTKLEGITTMIMKLARYVL